MKRRLLKALRARGIAMVHIDYDGEGDDGQVVAIAALDAQLNSVTIDRPVRLALRDGETPTRYDSLHEALDIFAWTILAHFHCGFENNDGGFGTITIDVGAATVSLDHDDRFTDTTHTKTEV